MNVDLEGAICDSEAARLLPWFATDRLQPADSERVTRHIEHCAICRCDLEHGRSLRAALKDDGPIEYAPQTGLAKTLARIDELHRLEETASARGVPRRHASIRRRRTAATRWLTAAVVVQAIGLGVLGNSMFAREAVDHRGPKYATLSSPTPVAGDGRIRAVFDRTTTIGELTTLLGPQRLTVVDGPTAAGVFILAPRDSAIDAARVGGLLTQLRADAHVMFAEPATK